MIVTNMGGRVTVGDCSLQKGANEVAPKLWQQAKQHRLVQAFLKSGRLVEGHAAMPGRGILPDVAVPHDPEARPPFDARAGIPTAANLAKPGQVPAPPPAAPAPQSEAEGTTVADPPQTDAPPAEASTEAEADAPDVTTDAPSQDEEQKNPTEYAVGDAKLIVKDCSDVETLKGWLETEQRKTVAAEIEQRLEELQS